MTTPSALSKVASRYFLDAQPPLSEEGTTFQLFLQPGCETEHDPSRFLFDSANVAVTGFRPINFL